MKKLYLLIVLFNLLPWGLVPVNEAQAVESSGQAAKATVIKVLDQRIITRNNGQEVPQQELELKVNSGELAGQVIKVSSISDLDVINTAIYQPGDRVYISYYQDELGQPLFFITDYDRGFIIYIIAGLFCLTAIIIGGSKGLRSIFSLVFSFAIIMKVLIPAVNHGYNPLWIGIGVSFVMLLAIIYLTEGWSKKSHLAVIAIFCGLLVTAIISLIFADWSRLTGMSQEEITYLIDSSKQMIDFKNLLLASFIIGTLGVLDDLVISQIETVQQIKEANPELKTRKVFGMAMKVGRSHMGSMTNTLFLAYAGASFPLLMLINIQNPPFLHWTQAINNEEIATEIVRTFVGVIGLYLTVPIATWLASRYLNQSKDLDLNLHHQH